MSQPIKILLSFLERKIIAELVTELSPSMKLDTANGRVLTFTQDDEIESAVRDYIPFYNGTRIHSSLNYVPPATYERLA